LSTNTTAPPSHSSSMSPKSFVAPRHLPSFPTRRSSDLPDRVPSPLCLPRKAPRERLQRDREPPTSYSWCAAPVTRHEPHDSGDPHGLVAPSACSDDGESDMSRMPSFGTPRGHNGSQHAAGATPPSVSTPQSTAIRDCAAYVGGRRLQGHWTYSEAITEVRARAEGYVWLGLHEPDTEQIQGVATTFGLHELAIEDAVHAGQRPKLERYGETLFMVLRPVS